MSSVPSAMTRRASVARRASAGANRRLLLGFAFISPAMLLFLIFIVGPFVAAIALSFYSWDLLTPAKPAGWTNYAHLFHDPVLRRVLLNTFVFAFASVVSHIVGALLLALAVNRVMNKAPLLLRPGVDLLPLPDLLGGGVTPVEVHPGSVVRILRLLRR